MNTKLEKALIRLNNILPLKVKFISALSGEQQTPMPVVQTACVWR